MTLKEKVLDIVDKDIRPSLQADGGDIKIIDVNEEGQVKVELTGACQGCPMSQMTLKMGVEHTLKKKIPEVKEVVAV